MKGTNMAIGALEQATNNAPKKQTLSSAIKDKLINDGFIKQPEEQQDKSWMSNVDNNMLSNNDLDQKLLNFSYTNPNVSSSNKIQEIVTTKQRRDKGLSSYEPGKVWNATKGDWVDKDWQPNYFGYPTTDLNENSFPYMKEGKYYEDKYADISEEKATEKTNIDQNRTYTFVPGNGWMKEKNDKKSKIEKYLEIPEEEKQPWFEGQFIVSPEDNDRVYSGYTYSPEGNLAILDYLSGKGDTSSIEVDQPLLTLSADALMSGANRLGHRISEIPSTFGDYISDYKFVTQNGNEYDQDYIDKILNENSEYVDDLLDVRLTTENNPGAFAYSDIVMNITSTDKDGNPIKDEYGRDKVEKIQAVGIDEDGNGKFDIKVDENRNFYVLNDSNQKIYIPVIRNNDGNLSVDTNKVYVEYIPTADQSDAKYYSQQKNPLVLEDGTQIPAEDLFEIVNNLAYRYDKNPISRYIFKPKDEIDIMDNSGNIDWGKLGSNFVPLTINGIASTIPFFIPGFGPLYAGANIWNSAHGLSAEDYDYKTDTYKNPIASTKDQYFGNLLADTAEYASDYAVAKMINSGKYIGGRIGDLFGKSEAKMLKKQEKDIKKLEQSFPIRFAKRTAKAGVYEGGQETIPDLFEPFRDGMTTITDTTNWYADKATDEKGDIIYNENGIPYYDENTSYGKKLYNYSQKAIPSFIFGGLAGGIMGSRQNIIDAKADRALAEILKNQPLPALKEDEEGYIDPYIYQRERDK